MEFMLILALALSIDSLCVGLSYGMRRIEIPFMPLTFISLISGVSAYISIHIGNGLAVFLSPHYAKIIGAVILIGVGLYIFISTIRDKNAGTEDKEILSIRLNFIKITIQVIQQPLKADLDNSGTISNSEAIFLGIALALDTFGAGLGAAMSSMEITGLPVAIGVFNMFFLLLGEFVGRKIDMAEKDRLEYLPGIVLIILGFITMI